MQYKSISLELLKERTVLYKQLRQTRQLSSVLDRWARELKESHDIWKEKVAQAKPNSHPMQIASEAMEMALKEFAERLPPVSPPDDSERLDEAMAFIRNHTSNG